MHRTGDGEFRGEKKVQKESGTTYYTVYSKAMNMKSKQDRATSQHTITTTTCVTEM